MAFKKIVITNGDSTIHPKLPDGPFLVLYYYLAGWKIKRL